MCTLAIIGKISPLIKPVVIYLTLFSLPLASHRNFEFFNIPARVTFSFLPAAFFLNLFFLFPHLSLLLLSFQLSSLMIILLFFIAHWYLALFFQTFFQHRYAAHKSFEMSKTWEKIFFVLSYLAQGSSYMSPRAYGIMHRLHHAYTDTEKDPHSPKYAANIFIMMWRTRTFYLGIFNRTMPVEARFSVNVPEWDRFDRWAGSAASRVLWVVLYTAFYVYFAPSAWYYLLLPFTIAMGAVHGAIINWFAHKYGYSNYRLKNTAENLFSPDVFMLGESYHNNHHKHPSAINFGRRWFEFDPVYPVILLLKRLRVIQIPVPVVSRSIYKRRPFTR